MKLKLPLTLLAALFACMNLALAEDTTTGDTTTTEPTEPTFVVGDETNQWGINDHVSDNNFIFQDVIWETDYILPDSGSPDASGMHGTLSIGSWQGEGSLTIAAGVEAGTGNMIKVGGPGYYTGTLPSDVTSRDGYAGTLTIEKDARFTVGAKTNSRAGAHLDIGNKAASSTVGGEGTVNVNGGWLQSDAIIYVGESARGTLNITDGGTVFLKHADHIPQTSGTGTELYVGLYGEGVVNMDTGSHLTVEGKVGLNNLVYMGTFAGSPGVMNISGASDATFTDMWSILGYQGKADIYVREGSKLAFEVSNSATSSANVDMGYAAGSSGSIDVADAGSSVSFDSRVHVGRDGSGSLAVSGGASASVMNYLCMGLNTGSAGTTTVTGTGSSLDVWGDTYVGYGGKGELKVQDGAEALLMNNVEVASTGTMAVTGGSSVEVIGNVSVAAEGKVTVENADVTVLGGYANAGTTTVTLGNGNSFTAGDIENSGTMSVSARAGSSFTADSVTVNQGATMNMSVAVGQEAGATFEVGTYTNRGTSSIDAAAGTTCYFGALVLEDGTMTMTGEGKYVLGNAPSGESGAEPEAAHTTFTVFGESAETASTTTIDITELNEQIFDIQESTTFTLSFAEDMLATSALHEPQEMKLLLIEGYEGFALDDEFLANLLTKTTYETLTSGDTAALTLLGAGIDMQTSENGGFYVQNAAYLVEDNNLYWTGTVTTVPEPTTATLSLLALAALAARRRRK